MAVKTRTAKTSPNTAGKARGFKQHESHEVNLQLTSQGLLTPWGLAKNLRLSRRTRAGKTYANWLKKQSAASNYKGSGKHAVKVTPFSELQPDDRRKVAHRDDAMNLRCNGCEHLVKQCICDNSHFTEYADNVLTKIGHSS